MKTKVTKAGWSLCRVNVSFLVPCARASPETNKHIGLMNKRIVKVSQVKHIVSPLYLRLSFGALFPSKSGLIHKHVVKHKSGLTHKHVVKHTSVWTTKYIVTHTQTYRETYRGAGYPVPVNIWTSTHHAYLSPNKITNRSDQVSLWSQVWTYTRNIDHY
jgi:hypothetical protein